MSPSKKLQRQQSSSYFKIKYLSSASNVKWKQAAQQKHQQIKQKLPNTIIYVGVTLDDNQSDELSSMMENIKEQCHNKLDKLFQKTDATKSIGENM